MNELAERINRTLEALGIAELLYVEDLPVITATLGYTRRSFEPTYEFVTWARKLMGEKLVLQNNGTGVEANPERGTPQNQICAKFSNCR